MIIYIITFSWKATARFYDCSLTEKICVLIPRDLACDSFFPSANQFARSCKACLKPVTAIPCYLTWNLLILHVMLWPPGFNMALDDLKGWLMNKQAIYTCLFFSVLYFITLLYRLKIGYNIQRIQRVWSCHQGNDLDNLLMKEVKRRFSYTY